MFFFSRLLDGLYVVDHVEVEWGLVNLTNVAINAILPYAHKCGPYATYQNPNANSITQTSCFNRTMRQVQVQVAWGTQKLSVREIRVFGALVQPYRALVQRVNGIYTTLAIDRTPPYP